MEEIMKQIMDKNIKKTWSTNKQVHYLHNLFNIYIYIYIWICQFCFLDGLKNITPK